MEDLQKAIGLSSNDAGCDGDDEEGVVEITSIEKIKAIHTEM